ncbi:MAG: arsenate reductase ArsC [Longimicrobiales bacterium]
MSESMGGFGRGPDAGAGRENKRLRVLFLCTGNSARSQIAEALLGRRGARRFDAGSAGVQPRAEVHPDALVVLAEYGIDWSSHDPKGIESVQGTRWDFVITVCDRAKESCPTFPGQPIFAHWGMPDPAEVEEPEARRRAFRDTLQHLSRRIDLMLAIPIDSLERYAVEERLRRIGLATADTSDVWVAKL